MLDHIEKYFRQDGAPHIHAYDLAVVDNDILKSLAEGSSDFCIALSRNLLHSVK